MTTPYDGRLSLSWHAPPDTSGGHQLAHDLGLNGVGIGLGQARGGTRRPEQDIRDALNDTGLRVTLAGPAVFSILPLPAAFGGATMFAGAAAARDPQERVRLICESLPRLAAHLNPVGVVIAPGNSEIPRTPQGRYRR